MCWGEEKPFTSFRLRSVLASGVEGWQKEGAESVSEIAL